MGRPAAKSRRAVRFPWLLLLILLGTIYLFWVFPNQRGYPPVQVDFEPAPQKTSP